MRKLALLPILGIFLMNFTLFTAVNFTTNSRTFNPDEVFFEDDENDILFIDFAMIDEQVETIQLFKKKKVLFEDDCQLIPSNAIYELELSTYKKGKYLLELQTETQTIQKSIQIKKGS